MARIKIECFKEDKEFIFNSMIETCPFDITTEYCKGVHICCEECIYKYVEFVIKEEEE